ncbi:MAG: hypothetical protein WA326_12340 [Nitrososphaeraceae archaeon]
MRVTRTRLRVAYDSDSRNSSVGFLKYKLTLYLMQDLSGCCSFGIDIRKPKYSSGRISLVMSAPSSYVDPEERERRLRELANRLVDEVRVEPDYNVNQTKRENANIKEDLTQEFLKFIKISEECEMNREILEAVVYKDIAEEIHTALKKFDNV